MPATWTHTSRPVLNVAMRSLSSSPLARSHHPGQSAGQFGPAVRAEELLGKSVGMFIDRSLQLTGALNDSHIAALIEIARKRQQEPIDLADDDRGHDQCAVDSTRGHDSDSE